MFFFQFSIKISEKKYIGCRTDLAEVYTIFRVDPKLILTENKKKDDLKKYHTAAYLPGEI
jgi:hypothetical protein